MKWNQFLFLIYAPTHFLHWGVSNSKNGCTKKDSNGLTGLKKAKKGSLWLKMAHLDSGSKVDLKWSYFNYRGSDHDIYYIGQIVESSGCLLRALLFQINAETPHPSRLPIIVDQARIQKDFFQCKKVLLVLTIVWCI